LAFFNKNKTGVSALCNYTHLTGEQPFTLILMPELGTHSVKNTDAFFNSWLAFEEFFDGFKSLLVTFVMNLFAFDLG